MPEGTLIFNADDFGWTDGHNQAVQRAHLEGVLNRASILAIGPAFYQAVEIAKNLPDLSVGVHLALNEGAPLLSPDRVGALVNSTGAFWDTPADLVRIWLGGKLNTARVLPEWRTQLERALDAGLKVSHLDSHKHVHMLPPLLETIIHLAKEYGISYVRLPLENPFRTPFRLSAPALWALACLARQRLLRAGLHFADRFIGFGTSGKMSLSYLEQAVRGRGTGTTEIMVHPAVLTPAVQDLIRRYPVMAEYHFEQELEALIALKSRLTPQGSRYAS